MGHGEETPGNEEQATDGSLRLLADGMLGRLARWLRLLGYDTAYENHADDLELARRARAEGRILLTRDRALAARRGLRSLLIESEHVQEQVRQVVETLGPPPHPALSRCSLCNVPLEPATPRQVADRVPPYVLQTQRRFGVCPACRRVYWAGTHLQHMRRYLRSPLAGRLLSDPPAESPVAASTASASAPEPGA
ncbi:MAG: Mut7-C RNAse domain-containing protein [Anaerolineae bacterium]|nr:Mut7-C RNAse domain-containing protein [Anaerolineae bacterium]MDW8068778.1 Mut7-C RNAse domain-containing protein [Anaerolineae bacterium]